MEKIGEIQKASMELFKKALIEGKKPQELIDEKESEGQKKVNTEIMLSRDMQPAKEVWEKLGFVFYEIPGNNVLYKAELPKGWKLVPNEHPMWTDLIDEQGNLRGQMFYKASYSVAMSRMELFNRYNICRRSISMDPIVDEIYFGNSEEVLFVGGKATLSLNPTEEQREEYFKQLQEARLKTRQFAETNYPGWEDPAAYWDKPKQNTQTL